MLLECVYVIIGHMSKRMEKEQIKNSMNSVTFIRFMKRKVIINMEWFFEQTMISSME